MFRSTKGHRPQNPRENANLFAKIVYSFTFPIFRQGLKRALQVSDVYGVTTDCQSGLLASALDAKWDEEKRKRNPKLVFCFFKMFGVTYACLGIGLLLINTVTMDEFFVGGRLWKSYYSIDQRC
ncbi:cystic fibrosis transmembrane conductance regulator-like isoform X2 [Photinus pyralis]|uniref:cystic fibrosis transmembrane conductance regulator-like isoform X2 n=1 Tax=Photinus pyralis TaxID=7054 RepID=UPI001266EDAE|nr:cystic fibrosis transmembrane conductance regulator-like isoform X2 [Photinus pyralis]